MKSICQRLSLMAAAVALFGALAVASNVNAATESQIVQNEVVTNHTWITVERLASKLKYYCQNIYFEMEEYPQYTDEYLIPFKQLALAAERFYYEGVDRNYGGDLASTEALYIDLRNKFAFSLENFDSRFDHPSFIPGFMTEAEITISTLDLFYQ